MVGRPRAADRQACPGVDDDDVGGGEEQRSRAGCRRFCGRRYGGAGVPLLTATERGRRMYPLYYSTSGSAVRALSHRSPLGESSSGLEIASRALTSCSSFHSAYAMILSF